MADRLRFSPAHSSACVQLAENNSKIGNAGDYAAKKTPKIPTTQRVWRRDAGEQEFFSPGFLTLDDMANTDKEE
jgi:hypothetical protein